MNLSPGEVTLESKTQPFVNSKTPAMQMLTIGSNNHNTHLDIRDIMIRNRITQPQMESIILIVESIDCFRENDF